MRSWIVASVVVSALAVGGPLACSSDDSSGGGGGGNGGSGGTGASGNCDSGNCVDTDGVCLQWSAPAAALPSLKAECENDGGTWATGGCADHGTIGGCKIGAPQYGAGFCALGWFDAGQGTREQAKTACEAGGGTFVDP